jgi:hypothetical protein
MMSQEISTERIIVQLFGELDVVSAPRLEERLDQLRRDGAQLITLDLSGMEFVGAAGLSVFIGADPGTADRWWSVAAHPADAHGRSRPGDHRARHHAERPVRAVTGGWISCSPDRHETDTEAHGACRRPLTGPPMLGTVNSRGSKMVGLGCLCR